MEYVRCTEVVRLFGESRSLEVSLYPLGVQILYAITHICVDSSQIVLEAAPQTPLQL